MPLDDPSTVGYSYLDILSQAAINAKPAKKQGKRRHMIAPQATPWLGVDQEDRSDWIFRLGLAERAELERAVEAIRIRGQSLDDLTRDDFDLRVLAETLSAIDHELRHGRGFVMLRGLAAERYHARTDYRDHPDPALKRHLLRLWLMMPHWPSRAARMSFHHNVDRAGGGVRPGRAGARQP
jgi:hypothetical protein